MTYADESAARAALADGTAIPADLRQIVVSYPELRPAVAAYPGTDEPMLGWLRDLHDPLVDAQLAARSRQAEPEPTELLPTEPLPAVASPLVPGLAAATPAPPPAGPALSAGTPPGSAAERPTPQPAGPAVQPVPATAPVPAQAYPVAPAPAGGPPGPTYTPVTPAPGGSGGGPGGKIAVIAVLAVLLLGGGVYAAFAGGLLPGFAPEPGQATASAPPPPSVEPPSGEPSSPPPATTTPSPPPAGFACWDAAETDSLADCPVPESPEQVWQYLRYVYPSLDRHDDCRQIDSTGKSDYQGVTSYWQCELGDSLLRYRYWVDPSDAERHYGRKFKDSTAGTYDVAISGQPVEGWVKTSVEAIAKQSDGSRRYVATMWLPELQLSMSAEGDDVNAMWNAFDLVRIRPLDQVNGHSLGTDPGAVPLTIAER